jgi:hypothetical protein
MLRAAGTPIGGGTIVFAGRGRCHDHLIASRGDIEG